MRVVTVSGDRLFSFLFQAEDGIRDLTVTGVQTCALPIFLDLELQALQGREQLGLELALQLLAFLEEVLHQVAEPVRQLPPGGDGVDLGRFARLAFLRQRVHPSLLSKGRSERLQVYAREGWGVRGARARSETGTVLVFTTRLCVEEFGIGGRAAEGTRLESV